MLLCYGLIRVLTALSAIFMAHEAVRTTGVDVLGYVLQAFEIAPSSPQFFRDIAARPALEIMRVKDSHHDVETRFDPPISTDLAIQESEEINVATLNTATSMKQPETEQPETGPSQWEPDESVEAPVYHLTNVYHRLVAGLKRCASTLPSFWLPILSRYAFALRRGFEVLGAQIYDPIIFAEFKSTFKAGILSIRKSTKVFNWLLVAFCAALGSLFAAVKITQSIYFLVAAFFVLYPQFIVTTSEHEKAIAKLQRQLEFQKAEVRNITVKLERQHTEQETANAAHKEELELWRGLAIAHRGSATSAKAERYALRQRLRTKYRVSEEFPKTADSAEFTEPEETQQGAGSQDEEPERVFVGVAEETEQDAKEEQSDSQKASDHVREALFPEDTEQEGTEPSKELVHVPEDSSQNAEKREEILWEALVRTPKLTPQEADQVPVVHLSPTTVKADPAASLETEKPKLSAAAPSFVPSGADTFSPQPRLGLLSSIHSSEGVRDPSPPVSRRANPTSTFGHFSDQPLPPPFHPLPSRFQSQVPVPAPFHVNGFRQGTPSFGTSTRQPNAAGQMFVPRSDRQSNRQRAQQQAAQGYSGRQGFT